MIPSDDEELAGHRSCSHTSSNTSSHKDARVDRLDSIPTPAVAAASAWRAFHRPRMALAVLAVSLQHIAAHSSHHHHEHQQPSESARPNAVEEASENDATPPTSEAPVSPAPVGDARASSLDEGIEPDR